MIASKVILVFALIAVSYAASVEKDVVPILSQESEVDPSGKFHYSYESGDGSRVSQDGHLKAIEKEQGEAIEGQFEYKGDDGQTYSVKYIADENGYQPQGQHLPVAPAVPPLIARALDYLATAKPPKEESH